MINNSWTFLSIAIIGKNISNAFKFDKIVFY